MNTYRQQIFHAIELDMAFSSFNLFTGVKTALTSWSHFFTDCESIMATRQPSVFPELDPIDFTKER